VTIDELYAWAKANDALNLDIEVQHRDGGGVYQGVDECDPVVTDKQVAAHTDRVVLL
jgi:hypothetical protein